MDNSISVTLSDPKTGQVETVEGPPDQFFFYGTSERTGPHPKWVIYRKEVYAVEKEQGTSDSYHGVFPINSEGKVQVRARTSTGTVRILSDIPTAFEFFGNKIKST